MRDESKAGFLAANGLNLLKTGHGFPMFSADCPTEIHLPSLFSYTFK